MHFASPLSAALALAVSALAAPTVSTTEVEKRAQTICGDWDYINQGQFSMWQNLWGTTGATGSQCSTLNWISGNTISWSTEWTWQGNIYGVKSYANVALLGIGGQQIQQINSIPTAWSWSYSGDNLHCDVAYDIFTSSQAYGTNNHAYEIMIWLAAIGGAGPISATGQPIDNPWILGTTWKLYEGPNGDTTVYSFVADSEQTNFNVDMKGVFNYLQQYQNFPMDQYLVSIAIGTEPFTGNNAVLTTNSYSISIT